MNRIVRPRLTCACCERFVQAPLPSRPIERGRPGPGLLAHVLVSKYADHLPLYRQSQIFDREGLDLDRSTLADWVAEWDLPPEFATLRRLMEARMLKMGRREYVQVLRLLETFGIDDLHAAVKKALQLGAVGFDAVKHLVLCQIEKRPPKLDLDVYPYLPRAHVATTSAAAYMSLLSGDAA